MHPQVLKRVISRTEEPSYTPVTLLGYARFRVKDQDYPGVVAAVNAPANAFVEDGEQVSVKGMLVTHLSQAAVTRLDAFEGDEYTRRPVAVIDAKGQEHTCETYIYSDPSQLEPHVWSFEEFEREKLTHWTGNAEYAMLENAQDGTNGRSAFV